MLVDISNHLDIFVYSTLSYELNISYCRPLRTTAWSNATVSRPPPAWKTIRYVELFTGCPGFISWVKHKWNCENIYIKKNSRLSSIYVQWWIESAHFCED